MDTWVTSHTLLQRARNANDTDAWTLFVARYKNFIYYVLRQMNIQHADVEDLTQEILLNLWKNLDQYKKEKAKFRTWLGTIIRNTAMRHIQKQQKRKIRDQKSLENQPEIDGMLISEPDLDRLIEQEWAAYITNLAMERVKEIFRGNAIKVFELSRKGRSLDDIADELGITKASANTLRNRVKNSLMTEIKQLVDETEF